MGIFNELSSSSSFTTGGFRTVSLQGPAGPQGIGFKLTQNGNYDIQNKKLVNYKQGADLNNVVTKSQIQLLDNAPGNVQADKAVIYSNTGSVHTNSIYLQDTPNGVGSSNDVRLLTEHQSYENIHLHIPDLQNFDDYGGRAKSEIMVRSTEQHVTGRKTFFDINVLKPDINDQAANKKYVDDEIKKIPSPDLSTYLKKHGSVAMTGNLNMGNQEITNLGANIQNTYDVVNLGFCDTKYLQKVSNSNLDMDNHKIKDMAQPTDDNDATTAKYVDTNFLKIAGGTMKGTLRMDDNLLLGLPNPTYSHAAAPKDYVHAEIRKISGNVDLSDYLKKDGCAAMTGNLDINNQYIQNIKTPKANESDKSANVGFVVKQINDSNANLTQQYKDYMAQSQLISSHKTNEFKYLYDTDESASENNITVDGFENNFRESKHQNKKAYSITLIKNTDGSNDYRSGVSFNLYPLDIGTYTMIFEYYWPEATNVSLSAQGTTVYIHKQVYRAFNSYGKLLVQINNNSKDTPDRITLVIHGRAVVQNPEDYLVIYGVKDWSGSVDPRVYDGYKTEMFDYINNQMVMTVPINMMNHKMVNLPNPTNPSDPTTKKYVDYNVHNRDVQGNWNFGNKNIYNIRDPANDLD